MNTFLFMILHIFLNLAAIPLVDSSNELLCIQFHTDPGDNETTNNCDLSFSDSISLLNDYLDVVRLDSQVPSSFSIFSPQISSKFTLFLNFPEFVLIPSKFTAQNFPIILKKFLLNYIAYTFYKIFFKLEI